MPQEGEAHPTRPGLVWTENGPFGQPAWVETQESQQAAGASRNLPPQLQVQGRDVWQHRVTGEVRIGPRPEPAGDWIPQRSLEGFADERLREPGALEARFAGEIRHEEEESLRQRAIDTAYSIPDLIRQDAARQEQLIREAGVDREAELRRQAAQALAGGLAQAGMPTSGAAFAQGRQTALDVAAGVGDIQAGVKERLAAMPDHRVAAAQAELEAITFEREAGTAQSDAQKLIAGYRTEVAAIIDRHKGTFDDDEDAMAAEILSLAELEDNPIAKQFLLNEADGVRGFGPHGRDV